MIRIASIEIRGTSEGGDFIAREKGLVGDEEKPGDRDDDSPPLL